MDKVRHVSSCGSVSLGLGTVVAVPGVRCGRARLRIVWIMFLGLLSRPVLSSSFPHGQFGIRFGSDSLKASHSGMSTDVLLLSDIDLSLVHHHRIHKRGLPHIAFRKDYMARLRALLPPEVAQSREEMLSPVSSGPVSLRHARSAELESESPWRTRRAKRRMRPVRVMGGGGGGWGGGLMAFRF